MSNNHPVVNSKNLLDDIYDQNDANDSSSPFPVTEIVVLTIKECFVYKVPPLRSASGHR
jgi:hypothetical protein